MNFRTCRGFTILELMIVVAIIAILIAIAVPEYQRLQSAAKRTEAYTVLQAVQIAEHSYLSENEKFTVGLPGVMYVFPFVTQQPRYYSIVTIDSHSVTTGYWARVEGNIDRDLIPDVFVLKIGNPASPYPAVQALPQGITLLVDDLVL